MSLYNENQFKLTQDIFLSQFVCLRLIRETDRKRVLYKGASGQDTLQYYVITWIIWFLQKIKDAILQKLRYTLQTEDEIPSWIETRTHFHSLERRNSRWTLGWGRQSCRRWASSGAGCVRPAKGRFWKAKKKYMKRYMIIFFLMRWITGDIRYIARTIANWIEGEMFWGSTVSYGIHCTGSSCCT